MHRFEVYAPYRKQIQALNRAARGAGSGAGTGFRVAIGDPPYAGDGWRSL